MNRVRAMAMAGGALGVGTLGALALGWLVRVFAWAAGL